MTLLLISFLAGILTILAPCILPLLPIIIGSSVGGRKMTPFIVIGSLAVSVFVFTYLLKASTLLIDIPTVFWSYLSGSILAIFGLVLLFPQLWESLPFVAKASGKANKLMGAGHQKKSIWGDVIVGVSLGPVFSTCSPTYFVILGVILPASFWLGTLYLLAFIFGLVLILSLIALLGQRLTQRLTYLSDSRGWFKRVLGLLFILVGLAIVTGLDKKIETSILDTGFLNISIFEQKILDSVLDKNEPTNIEETDNEVVGISSSAEEVIIPKHLVRAFKTDWSKVDPKISSAISGGPTKDGIPAIDKPKFVPLSSFKRSDDIQALVLKGEKEVKVYPYNILTWHEIVNDEIDGRPVFVTFCPLCGSAVVYDRTLPDGRVSTFGVSGSLVDSNMIMYDRLTENLWQQSTGEVIAGSFFPSTLQLLPFQLLAISEIRKLYPEALILSENTGYSRDYGNNPYSGYETNSQFLFPLTDVDDSFPPKEMMVVFRADDTAVAVPWLKLREIGRITEIIDGNQFTLEVSNEGKVFIFDESNTEYPFYFEMWFSFAVQNKKQSHVINI